jgi:predicted dehydrogenase
MQMKYRAGVIGCGRMAGTIDDEITYPHNDFILPYGHANGYAAIDEIELVAAADTVADKLTSWCDRFEVARRYADYRDMIATENIDIVSVTTPAHARAQPLIHAAESGVRGIYSEKALCVSAIELDEIVAACNTHGTQLVYGAMRRYWAGFETARAFLDSGVLGTPQAALIGATSGSALHTHSHIVDAALYLLGDPLPVSMSARLRGKDGGDLQVQESAAGLELADDPSIIHGVIHMEDGRRLVCTDLPFLDIEIVCSEGTLRNSGDSSYWIPRKSVSRYDWTELPQLQWTARSGTIAIIQDLLQALESGSTKRGGLEIARRGMEILFGLIASHHAGGATVDLPLADRNVRVMSH